MIHLTLPLLRDMLNGLRQRKGPRQSVGGLHKTRGVGVHSLSYRGRAGAPDPLGLVRLVSPAVYAGKLKR
jgi:hypothetical protein